jgi:hypothetical protein
MYDTFSLSNEIFKNMSTLECNSRKFDHALNNLKHTLYNMDIFMHDIMGYS